MSEAPEPDKLPRAGHGLSPDQVRANQEQRLISAICRVVAERGYRGASVSRIIGSAGVSRSTFYELFESRSALLLAARARLERRLDTAIEAAAAAAGSGDERLHGAVSACLAVLTDEPGSTELLFGASRLAGPEAAGMHDEAMTRWSLQLRRCLAGLEPKDRAPDAAAPGASRSVHAPGDDQLARMALGAGVAVVRGAAVRGRRPEADEVVRALLIPVAGYRPSTRAGP